MRLIICALLVAGVAVPQIKMPPFERVVLDNGATLILMPKRELPLMSVRVAVRGGAEAAMTQLRVTLPCSFEEAALSQRRLFRSRITRP